MRPHKIMKARVAIKTIYDKQGRDIALLNVCCWHFQGWITTPEKHKLRAYLDTLTAENDTKKGVKE